MPRKSTKKETTPTESKTEGTTRRSGRSVTKQEPTASKEASRSRRGSTAAQTAASVADSKPPKGRSSSPAESRQKTRRESAEPRAKSSRRAASRVNYKESDGEEEGVEKKFDDSFDSNEEFEDSDSDEKSKPKGRTRGSKTPVKGRGLKGKGKSPRSRRGRPAKKQSSDDEEEDEEMEAIELSEDSVEIDEVKKPKETTRSSRGRKSKADESTKESDDKPKSRRSVRATVPREESPRKRPTRGVQAKKYTEDDDDIEEIDETQEDEKAEGGRKRKRGSTSDSNKRLKEDDESEEQKGEAGVDEKDDDVKPDIESEKGSGNTETKDEPMEVDEMVADKDNSEESAPSTAEKEVESKSEAKESENKSEDKLESEESAKEKPALSKKQESVSSENLDESMQSFDSDQGSRPEQSVSSGLEDSQDVKETKSIEKTSESGTEKAPAESQRDSANSIKEADSNSESKNIEKTDANKEQNVATVQESTDAVSKNENSVEKVSNDVNVLPENKASEKDNGVITSVVTHSKEANIDNLNGSEKSTSTAPVAHSAKSHTEEAVPTANGAHDSHTNSNSESDQYYPLPGRKYVVNTKLGESIRQSVKDKSFGFVSYNLGLSSSDSSIQKEKLLNELNKLDAHIICIQEVSKSLYAGILEPSLDALGFKGTFSQPEESEKGIATFYKSSLFRLSGQTETSLKHLIEKELEAAVLGPNERPAVKSHVKKCGHVLFTHFATVIGTHSLTVANVQIPPTDLSIHALQVSCLAREVVRVNGGTSKPFLLGGEFNMLESEAPYQLLRDGYLSNDMIDVLQRRADVPLPGKENGALVNLLWKSFQHPSSTLCSCYKSILDHEVFIPEQKTTSPDLLWYNSDSLYTVGVVDTPETAATGRHFSLKADVAFSM